MKKFTNYKLLLKISYKNQPLPKVPIKRSLEKKILQMEITLAVMIPISRPIQEVIVMILFQRIYS